MSATAPPKEWPTTTGRSSFSAPIAFASVSAWARTPAGGTESDAAGAAVQSPAAFAGPCMEAIVGRDNLRKALAQVQRNKGAAGVDGMSVEALSAHLKDHWPTIRARLLDGSYEPQPVRRVEIPKPGGGLPTSSQGHCGAVTPQGGGAVPWIGV